MREAFYFLALIPLMWEVTIFTRPAFTKNLIIILKDKKEADPYEMLGIGCVSLFYMVWCFIGLFTSEALIFMMLFALSFIPKRHIAWAMTDSILSFCLIVFAMLNSYHFHIDLFKLLKEFV